jgi:hypothetical protein
MDEQYEDDAEEHDEDEAAYDDVYVEETIGWGALNMSPREAMPGAIALWLDRCIERPEAINWLCLQALEAEDWPECQVAALEALMQLAERLPRLPKHDETITAVVRARKHPDPSVRAAATEAWKALDSE